MHDNATLNNNNGGHNMKVDGNEVYKAMQMHRRMMERGEITMTEFSHMNTILFFTYMPLPATH